jgi:hypothetical protein
VQALHYNRQGANGWVDGWKGKWMGVKSPEYQGYLYAANNWNERDFENTAWYNQHQYFWNGVYRTYKEGDLQKGFSNIYMGFGSSTGGPSDPIEYSVHGNYLDSLWNDPRSFIFTAETRDIYRSTLTSEDPGVVYGTFCSNYMRALYFTTYGFPQPTYAPSCGDPPEGPGFNWYGDGDGYRKFGYRENGYSSDPWGNVGRRCDITDQITVIDAEMMDLIPREGNGGRDHPIVPFAGVFSPHVLPDEPDSHRVYLDVGAACHVFFSRCDLPTAYERIISSQIFTDEIFLKRGSYASAYRETRVTLMDKTGYGDLLIAVGMDWDYSTPNHEGWYIRPSTQCIKQITFTAMMDYYDPVTQITYGREDGDIEHSVGACVILSTSLQTEETENELSVYTRYMNEELELQSLPDYPMTVYNRDNEVFEIEYDREGYITDNDYTYTSNPKCKLIDIVIDGNTMDEYCGGGNKCLNVRLEFESEDYEQTLYILRWQIIEFGW